MFKGLFLGLLVAAALAVPTPGAALLFGACLLAGTALGLLVAARRCDARPSGRWPAFLLFLFLEYPRTIAGGLLCGIGVGIRLAGASPQHPALMPALAAGGLVVGGLTGLLRGIDHRWTRWLIGLLLAGGVVAGGLFALHHWPDLAPDAQRTTIGLTLLLGLPFLYLLTFISEAEETELDVALWCIALALSIGLMSATPGLPGLGLLIPIAIYFVYTTRVLPGLRVFKHVLRGISYARVGLHREALAALGRAVRLDRVSPLARAALHDVHRRIDPRTVDDQLTQLIDPGLCLDRVRRLLHERPTDDQAGEASQLLALLDRLGDTWKPVVRYWRAVVATHQGDLDAATAHLTPLLESGADSFDAWQLALLAHRGLEKRVGQPALTRPGGRLAAIAAVERRLRDLPDDAEAWSLKRILYPAITTAELVAGPIGDIDAAYVEQLGRALITESGSARRGAELLAIAAAVATPAAPRLLELAAQTLAQLGDTSAAIDARRAGRRAGQQVGVDQLPAESRASYFTLLKSLADHALTLHDWAEAAEYLRDYSESDQSGIETQRALAECHEMLGSSLAALAATSRGLLFNGRDADLLARRDRYTYSVTPDQLRSATEAARAAVDVEHCLQQARTLLDATSADREQLDWARHLAELACIVRPASIVPRTLQARALLRLGQREAGLTLLEDIREQRPAKFPSSADEEAWMLANRLLGDLYLNELDRADLAVGCFLDYRASSRSGADTFYKLGMAYERLGDRKKAGHFYEQVEAYDGHPLAADARAGLRRVRS